MFENNSYFLVSQIENPIKQRYNFGFKFSLYFDDDSDKKIFKKSVIKKRIGHTFFYTKVFFCKFWKKIFDDF